MFVKGELSDYITAEDEADIHSLFPKAFIKSIPRATHWLHAENPEDFVTEIKRFLNLKE